jgi:energy-converting hydrogenase Eha subunit F
LLFFQLPSSLPLPKQTQSVEEPNTGFEKNAELANVTREQRRPSSFAGSKIKDLPGGHMGKILIYKSGKVKMKIGDALFDVSMKLLQYVFSNMFPMHVLKITNVAGISWLKLHVRPGGCSD